MLPFCDPSTRPPICLPILGLFLRSFFFFRLFSRSLVYSPVHSSVRSLRNFATSFVHFLLRSFACLLVRSFLHLFVRPFDRSSAWVAYLFITFVFSAAERSRQSPGSNENKHQTEGSSTDNRRCSNAHRRIRRTISP